MALSNIFREPRRELTESAVGIAVFGGYIWGNYEASVAFMAWMPAGFAPPLLVVMLMNIAVSILFVMATVAFLYGTHALGDTICNVLQERGIHLRPRQRK